MNFSFSQTVDLNAVGPYNSFDVGHLSQRDCDFCWHSILGDGQILSYWKRVAKIRAWQLDHLSEVKMGLIMRQMADYLLLESKEVDWYNIAKRTFECTKNMMSLHWFTLIKTYGEEIFDEYFTSLYNLGYQFGEMLHKHTSFEMPVKPQSNIVCFRYVKESLSNEELNKINLQIRQQLLEDGHFYIVQTVLNGKQYLRVTIMNPFTTEDHLQKLLAMVLKIDTN